MHQGEDGICIVLLLFTFLMAEVLGGSWWKSYLAALYSVNSELPST